MSIVPMPPGVAVTEQDPTAARIAPPSVANGFAVGFADRGTTEQISSVSDLRAQFGPRVSYSATHDAVATAIAEGRVPTITFARVTGPAATAASLDLQDAVAATVVTVTATSVGDWAHKLSLTVTTDGTDRKVVLAHDDDGILSTGSYGDVDSLIAALEATGVVECTVGAGTWPIVDLAETALAGGTDDRANVTVAEWTAALATLNAVYGPGWLIAPDATAADLHSAILTHCDENGRRALLNLAAGASDATATTHADGLRVSDPDVVRRGGLFTTWAYATPVAGEPERLVPWAAVQLGVASRVHQEHGVAAAPFGPRRAAARTVTRLYDERTDAERAALYAKGVNVATDDGQSFATWGYRTLDLEALHSDLHHQHVRMAIRYEGERILREFLGETLDAKALASLAGRIEGLCNELVAVRALLAYVVDVDNVNTPTTLAARELHAALRIQQPGTADWVTLTVTARLSNQTL